MCETTRILSEIESGEPHAAEELLPLELADAAGGTIIVTNNYGSVTSLVAQLTVTIPPNGGRFANFSCSPVMDFGFVFRQP